MKKLLFLLLVLPIISFGQWTENFDAGTTLPAGWAVINNGGDNGWFFGVPGSGTAQSGTNVASITFDSVAHDDHLITKAINIQVGISDRFLFILNQRNLFMKRIMKFYFPQQIKQQQHLQQFFRLLKRHRILGLKNLLIYHPMQGKQYMCLYMPQMKTSLNCMLIHL